MPELPEVETTIRGLKKILPSLTIVAIETEYGSSFHTGKNNIKNPLYFKQFKKEVIGTTVVDVTRRAKNILIHLSNGKTMLVHMKMTGHFLYGHYKKSEGRWKAKEGGALADPFNQFIRLIFFLSNGMELAFSDMRKFAKITLLPSENLARHTELKDLGPEPLSRNFTFELFVKCLMKRPKGKIKQVLMDQSIIAGIGNIYSDEILFYADIHPLSIVERIPKHNLKKMYAAMNTVLKKSILLGGDSASDFRNLKGEKGGFQNEHKAYRKTGKPCSKKSCRGSIERIKLGGRSAHFCSVHQVLY